MSIGILHAHCACSASLLQGRGASGSPPLPNRRTRRSARRGSAPLRQHAALQVSRVRASARRAVDTGCNARASCALAHRCSRERIPERVGARGYFECAASLSDVTKATVFSAAGKRTPLFTRFSSVTPERGGADTIREPRGFAVKLYAEDGNWGACGKRAAWCGEASAAQSRPSPSCNFPPADIVANTIPVFFIRDAAEFPHLIHSQKRHPKTDLFDPNAWWDFVSHHPESLHAATMVMGDRGLPASWRSVNGYANHTFVLVNAAGKRTLCKIHIKAQGGVKSLTNEAAEAIKGSDPDFLKRDLVVRSWACAHERTGTRRRQLSGV